MSLFFAILALGPALRLWGMELPVTLPYALAEAIFPPLELSGVPVRMMVMVMLSASIIAAFGVKMLSQQLRQKRALFLILAPWLVLLIVEYLPAPLPRTRVSVPEYVAFLKDLPEGAVIDTTITHPPFALYYQTIHQKPMAFGYISRIPQSVDNQNRQLRQLIQNKQYQTLCNDYGFKYLIVGSNTDVAKEYPAARALYEDATVKLYDLRAEGECGVGR